MNPGRELDALVAEKVMGWERGGQNDHTKPYHTKRTVIEEDGSKRVEHYLNWDSKGPHDRITSPSGKTIYLCGCKEDDADEIPHYSTDIAAAWEVVEKVGAVPIRLNDGRWVAIIPERDYMNEGDLFEYFLGEGYQAVSAAGETAPHAICLAAIKALERYPRP